MNTHCTMIINTATISLEIHTLQGRYCNPVNKPTKDIMAVYRLY